jgi:hypothetical protein
MNIGPDCNPRTSGFGNVKSSMSEFYVEPVISMKESHKLILHLNIMK